MTNLLGEGLTRAERLRIQLVLNSALANEYKTEVESLVKGTFPVNAGDTLTVTYEFCVEYFGQVVEKLRAITTLLRNPNVVRTVNLDELRHGESVIVAVLDEIRKVQACLQ